MSVTILYPSICYISDIPKNAKVKIFFLQMIKNTIFSNFFKRDIEDD
jgi:hypothetical protein